ncbi:TAP42-like protein [Wilcoxina mikolae CBS 423.85]|nr:TAP42-like protein [Wilcoxina mikolae CBS 423.85]
MSEELEQHSSIRSLLEDADALRDELSRFPDSNSDAYQTKLHSAISQYNKCQDIVERASTFGLNESLEDLTTSNMRCLVIPFRIAELSLKEKSPDRKVVIQRSMELYKEFIALCDSYDLVTPEEMSAAQNAGTKESVSSLPQDPGARRKAKIAQFKTEKELESKIQTLQCNTNADEEDLRLYYKALLRLAIMQTIQALEMIVLELDILAKGPILYEGPMKQGEKYDTRSRSPKNNTYDDKLDNTPDHIKGGALLSKDGKPLRPFTLINKRQQEKNGVFRPSHNLPTMTIDEYLKEEQKRGGIIEGGGEMSGIRPEWDEDDLELADRDTMKAREWDVFKEQNPRGSGNTLNRG